MTCALFTVLLPKLRTVGADARRICHRKPTQTASTKREACPAVTPPHGTKKRSRRCTRHAYAF
jgi:hypothetical protein